MNKTNSKLMVPKNKILKILNEYDKDKITIATLCSHSSLQIFNGAKKEGFKTLGLAIRDNNRFYDAFPLAKPDEIMKLSSYGELVDNYDEFLVPQRHSGPTRFFRRVYERQQIRGYADPNLREPEGFTWESDCNKMREWLSPPGYPCHGDRGSEGDRPAQCCEIQWCQGRPGFFIAKDYPDFKLGIDTEQPYTIQEYCPRHDASIYTSSIRRSRPMDIACPRDLSN